MKKIKQLLAILMTATMILSGTCLGGFGALSYAADEQNDAAAGQQLQEDPGTADPTETTTATPADENPELVQKTLKVSKVKLDGMMPEDAKATATDATSMKAVRKLDTGEGTTLAAYDITIRADGEEYQPDADHPITVQISDKEISKDSDLTIWHLKDDGSKEQIKDFTVENGKVIFDATGFSVYVIVEGPGEVDPGQETSVQTLSELAEKAGAENPTGFYMSITRTDGKTYYMMNSQQSKSGGYIIKATTDKTSAALWYFEPTGSAHEYYLYTLVGGEKKYIKVKNDNSTFLYAFGDDADPTVFTANLFGGSEGVFLLSCRDIENAALNYSGTNSGFKCYKNQGIFSNVDCRFTLTYPPAYDADPYNLDGKTYGIINYRGGTSATALQAEQMTNNVYNLKALSTQVRVDPIKKDSGNLVITKNEEDTISLWTFENESGDIYTLKSGDKYLRIAYPTPQNSGTTVTTEKDQFCKFKIIPCTGDDAGKIRIANCDGYELNNYEGKASNGFYARNSYSGPDNRMALVEESQIYDDDDFVEYTARKVSVSDTVHVTNGSQIVIYTRVWNEEKNKYDFYAIDHEGDLVYCYETGDHIRWTGAQVNTMLWEFTEYYYEGTTNPNYYYELQNTYSGKYIAPKIVGDDAQILSDSTIGINLEGRYNGEYSSTIVAWDDPRYDYTGLKVKPNGPKLTADVLADADTFYFAYMEETDPDDPTEVNTVDHEAKAGLTMNMVKFSDEQQPKANSNESFSSVQQYAVMGEQLYTQGQANSGLLSYDIKDNGYPTAKNTGVSLYELFNEGGSQNEGVKKVNHLFLKDTYEESGYFVYDCSQNFAELDGDTFNVYKELGTADVTGHVGTLDHGQFMPYNELDYPQAAGNHPENVTDITANNLPDDNPRKGETLYRLKGGEQGDKLYYNFGMQIDGQMMQTPSGKDKWGHDIIFEFTGDDDFWLYVDDLLVLDLGGIHKALSGSINYSTGEVIVNGVPTTLRELFRASYAASHPGEDVDAFLNKKFKLKNGNYVFKDYSLHTIKIFYMERGGGASNLRMRFNLSPVTPGAVLLSKELSGTDKDKYAGVKFPYQIMYDPTGDGDYEALDNSGTESPVTYQGSGEDVAYSSSARINGVTYNDVYYLKAGETAKIVLPDDTVDYYIVECGVDQNIFDRVQINSEEVTDPDGDNKKISRGGTIYDYQTSAESTADRAKVIFTNIANADNLRNINVKKKLVDRNGDEITDDDTGFRFRMYLGPAGDDPDYYRLGAYYVKDQNGNYCRYDSGSGKFVSLGVTEFSRLSPEQKKQARFTTSPSGAVDRIPNGYSFEIRDVLIGTRYKVEEKSYDMPKGYTFKEFTDTGYDPNCADIAVDSPNDSNNIRVQAVNEKGLGLTANKVWTDADGPDYHDDIYLAVYDANGLVTIDGKQYIKRIRTKTSEDQPVPDRSAYFYIPGSEDELGNYTVKEVKLTGTDISVDEEGFVTGYTGTVEPVDDSGTYINAYVDDVAQSHRYFVACETGDPEGNVRTDIVTNARKGGIQLIKEDRDGNRLSGAVFTLKKGSTNFDPHKDSFKSDSNGMITTMYGYEEDTDYTLTETEAPRGYTGLPSPVRIRIHDGQVEATCEDHADCVEVYQDDEHPIPTIVIKNRKSRFTVIKVDQAGIPLAGATFSLSRQVKVGDNYRKDYYPMEGFEALSSDADPETGEEVGVVISAAKARKLAAGTYYLTETQVPEGYTGLSRRDLLFTISELGEVTVDASGAQEYTLTSKGEGTADDPLVYELKVENTSTREIAPTGYEQNVLPFLLMLTGALLLGTSLLYTRSRRRSGE